MNATICGANFVWLRVYPGKSLSTVEPRQSTRGRHKSPVGLFSAQNTNIFRGVSRRKMVFLSLYSSCFFLDFSGRGKLTIPGGWITPAKELPFQTIFSLPFIFHTSFFCPSFPTHYYFFSFSSLGFPPCDRDHLGPSLGQGKKKTHRLFLLVPGATTYRRRVDIDTQSVILTPLKTARQNEIEMRKTKKNDRGEEMMANYPRIRLVAGWKWWERGNRAYARENSVYTEYSTGYAANFW